MRSSSFLFFVALVSLLLISVNAEEFKMICQGRYDPKDPRQCKAQAKMINRYRPANGVKLLDPYLEITYSHFFELDSCYDLKPFLGSACYSSLGLGYIGPKLARDCGKPDAYQGLNRACPIPVDELCSAGTICDNGQGCLDGKCQIAYQQYCKTKIHYDPKNPPKQCSASDLARLEPSPVKFTNNQGHIIGFILPDVNFTDCDPATLVRRGWSKSCVDYFAPSELSWGQRSCAQHVGYFKECPGESFDMCSDGSSYCVEENNCYYGYCIPEPYKYCAMKFSQIPPECPNMPPFRDHVYAQFKLVEPKVKMTPADQYFVRIQYGLLHSDMAQFSCEDIGDGWEDWPKGCLDVLKPTTPTDEQMKCLEDGAKQGDSSACA